VDHNQYNQIENSARMTGGQEEEPGEAGSGFALVRCLEFLISDQSCLCGQQPNKGKR